MLICPEDLLDLTLLQGPQEGQEPLIRKSAYLYNLRLLIQTGSHVNSVQISPALAKGKEPAGPLRPPTTTDKSEQVN